MKRIIIITGIAIAIIGLAAFGCSNTQTELKASNIDKIPYSTSNMKSAESNFNFVDTELEIEEKMELMYGISGKYNDPITMGDLKKAKSITDIIPNYPVNWIVDYNSVDISTELKGKEIMASSKDASLSKEQKRLFKSVDINTDLNISVKYNATNTITQDVDNEELNIMMTVVPEFPAEFEGGYNQMIQYLNDIGEKDFQSQNLKIYERITVSFVVNEDGGTEDITISENNGNIEIARTLIRMVDNMPKFKAAQNAKGQNVKQKFKFVVGIQGC